MKKLAGLILLLCFSLRLSAQQEPQFSQYMFNGLVLNPAYAGSKGHFAGALTYRKQWAGLDGAPETQSLGLHLPSKNLRHGYGLTMVRDQAGVESHTGINLNYAYRIPLWRDAYLGLGLNGGIRQYKASFSSLSVKDVFDPTFMNSDVNTLMPQFGAGIYLYAPQFFVGLASPQLLTNGYETAPSGNTDIYRRHYVFTGGALVPLGTDLKLRPALMVQYVNGAPPSADLHAGLLFRDKLLAGASYRIDNALAFILEWWPVDQLRLGYSYDLPTGQLSGISAGSHELMLGFELRGRKDKVSSPRYF